MASAQKILFRVDAALKIGTGHVMRCLTLAQALRLQGAESRFVCREHDGNLIAFIRRQGFAVLELPMGAAVADGAYRDWLGASWQEDAAQTAAAGPHDWLVIDHYALDARWEMAMRPHAAQLMVIDDLANRAHDCDLLLDQNLGRKPADYQPLIGPDCPLLLGPDFALLRPEFAEWRQRSLARRSDDTGLKTLLVTMGGVDQHNVTGDILAALKDCDLPKDVEIKVVMGPHAPWLADIKTMAKQMPWQTEVLAGISNMAELMSNSDLAIGAAGSTSWERCCLGLPTLALVLADNQRETAEFLEKAAAIVLLGDARKTHWQLRVKKVLQGADAKMLGALCQNAQTIVDGAGAERCVKAMGV